MSCPDICPTALWGLTEAVKLLTPEQQDQMQTLFVSVENKRDTPEALGIFVKGFHPDYLGLTDSDQENLDKVARQYSVIYEEVALKDSAMGYVIDHSSVIYLIDREGLLQYRIPHGEQPRIIADSLLKLIGEPTV
jgi:protein SCO1/2